jgi:hypothetical protein
VFFVFCHNDDNHHDVCWDNTAQALIWWRRLGTLHEATNMLHQSMCFTPYPLGGMVVKIAIKLLKF